MGLRASVERQRSGSVYKAYCRVDMRGKHLILLEMLGRIYSGSISGRAL
jgi:hypothetical protein